jgi:hypothetical protein
MARTAGSTASQTAARIEAALVMLEAGADSSTIRPALEAKFQVDSSTARRYIRKAEALFDQDCQITCIASAVGRRIRRLERLARVSEETGNLTAAVSAERAAVHALSSYHRTEWTGAARLHGHTVAVAEPNPEPSERKRRQYRRSADDLPADYPH